ncbi:Hypothetical predicted protein [Drosophila guanche]|uniref:Uncharacterized protein n=1 Tax=Drosophila guanche TaxID=7266 RepID=A0A3B0J5T3_DROGU|nr:Hypothetical predicted protein [Drosophila guanche]
MCIEARAIPKKKNRNAKCSHRRRQRQQQSQTSFMVRSSNHMLQTRFSQAEGERTSVQQSWSLRLLWRTQ